MCGFLFNHYNYPVMCYLHKIESRKGREMALTAITLFVMLTSEFELWKLILALELLIADKESHLHHNHTKKLIFSLGSIDYAFERNAYSVGLVDVICE